MRAWHEIIAIHAQELQVKISNQFAIAALSAVLVAGSAVAAPAQEEFAALQGVESTELSAVEMDAVTGQLTVAELTAFIQKLPASPLKSYLLGALANPKYTKLDASIVATLTKLGVK
jgi:hypothetical protein